MEDVTTLLKAIKKVNAMTQEEILDVYKKMGIGTEEERNKFLQWMPQNKENGFIFIINSPNSVNIEENNNA